MGTIKYLSSTFVISYYQYKRKPQTKTDILIIISVLVFEWAIKCIIQYKYSY